MEVAMKKEPTNGTYLFRVKNDLIGEAFYKLLKHFFNYTDFSILRRGRHSDRQGLFKKLKKKMPGWYPNNCQDVPLQYCEYFCIYVRPKFETQYEQNLEYLRKDRDYYKKQYLTADNNLTDLKLELKEVIERH
jgi:hypothetical protein